jgi:hypothetical protein
MRVLAQKRQLGGGSDVIGFRQSLRRSHEETATALRPARQHHQHVLAPPRQFFAEFGKGRQVDRGGRDGGTAPLHDRGPRGGRQLRQVQSGRGILRVRGLRPTRHGNQFRLRALSPN